MSITPEWFTPSTEVKKKVPRQFKVRGLSPLEAMDVYVYMTQVGTSDFRFTGEGLRIALRLGLLDWKDHKDKDGKAIKYALDDDTLNTFDVIVLVTIARKIMEKSRVDPDLEKN